MSFTANSQDNDSIATMALARRSRRQFLGGSAAAAAAALLGSSLLSACASDGGAGVAASSTPTPDDGAPATGALRISNWPLYISDGFVAAFQTATGLSVDYKEDFNDNEEWFAKYKEPLSRRQDIGADLVVPTQYMSVRLKNLGWLNEISDARVPNKKNLRPDLLNSSADPGRKYILPYMSGMTGLAYNKAATKRPITTIDDLWDPAFKGKVSMLSDMQDGLGMVMLAQGSSLENPDEKSVQKAVDVVREQKDKGQIRRFTGNDYADDLASGNVVIAQAYSGDVVQLKADNPDLEFVVPEGGGTWFVDGQVIPYTTQNQHGAEAWLNYVYDRANYAKLIAKIRYVPVLSDMTDELNKIDPALAANRLINPPESDTKRLGAWASLSDEQTQAFTSAYAAVTAN